MENVAYGVDDNSIFDYENKKPIEMNNAVYGYGIILKARNPLNYNKPAFLLGGLGTLGTKAAIYYFIKNIALIGNELGKKNFGIVVRVRIASDEQSTERLKKYDKSY